MPHIFRHGAIKFLAWWAGSFHYLWLVPLLGLLMEPSFLVEGNIFWSRDMFVFNYMILNILLGYNTSVTQRWCSVAIGWFQMTKIGPHFKSNSCVYDCVCVYVCVYECVSVCMSVWQLIHLLMCGIVVPICIDTVLLWQTWGPMPNPLVWQTLDHFSTTQIRPFWYDNH